ncbi:MAG TPA: chromate transporter [Ktedonobacteraceae bacterium]|jgi:chromate transporter
MQMEPLTPRPTTWQLFRIWASIGLQSFGGGGSTSLLIQREFIHKRGWLSMEEYLLYWNQCIFAPGTNLIALVILIGNRLGGIVGIVVSLLGMLVPSAAITCLFTIGFGFIERAPAIQAILKGIIPATAGFLLVLGLQFARPSFKQAYQDGWLYVIAGILLAAGSALAIILWQISVMIVIPCAALLGTLIFTSWRRPSGRNRTTQHAAEEVRRQ